tara:strand:- start:10402 stop:10914 length:513 start_codon:yes stop_codon:yes gene_type:complete
MMKNKLVLILFLFAFGVTNAQKVKMKKGKVYVDKKEYLTYKKTDKGDVFSSLEGKVLFILTKKSIEIENPAVKNAGETNTIKSDIEAKLNRTTQSDNLGRGNKLTKKKEIKYLVVKYFTFNLEYETTLKKSKFVKAFYKAKVLNIAGVIDQGKANKLAAKMRKDISGKKK